MNVGKENGASNALSRKEQLEQYKAKKAQGKSAVISAKSKTARATGKERISQLAAPTHKGKADFVSQANQLRTFQSKTPKRYHSQPKRKEESNSRARAKKQKLSPSEGPPG
jgi:hypothetical protein